MSAAADLAGRMGLSKRTRSWAGSCPACDYPRAFSVKAGKEDAVQVYCANGCTFAQLSDVLKQVAGSDWKPRAPKADPDAEKARAGKQEAARKLWAQSEAVPGTPADRYLSGRHLPGLAASSALRFLGDCRHPEAGKLPALVALVVDAAGQDRAVHRTYLAKAGTGKAAVDPPRATLGPYWHGAVRLAAFDPARPLVVGEGIESSASAGVLMNLPAWAALSAGNLAKGLVLPPEVRNVIVAGDPDPPGRKAARDAAERWTREGRTVQMAYPTGPGDFNDTLAARASAGAPNV